MDRIGGSGAFARDADTIITLTKQDNDDCYTADTRALSEMMERWPSRNCDCRVATLCSASEPLVKMKEKPAHLKRISRLENLRRQSAAPTDLVLRLLLQTLEPRNGSHKPPVKPPVQ